MWQPKKVEHASACCLTQGLHIRVQLGVWSTSTRINFCHYCSTMQNALPSSGKPVPLRVAPPPSQLRLTMNWISSFIGWPAAEASAAVPARGATAARQALPESAESAMPRPGALVFNDIERQVCLQLQRAPMFAAAICFVETSVLTTESAASLHDSRHDACMVAIRRQRLET